MTTIKIYRGIPGAGKSSAIHRAGASHRLVACAGGASHNQSANELEPQRSAISAIISADDYFTSVRDGSYTFAPELIGHAHNACIRAFLRALEMPPDARPEFIYIDNTNTSVAEIAPYVSIAQALGFPIQIITLIVDPAIAFARQKHGVPAGRVFDMDRRLREETARIPPWWPHALMFG